MILLSLVSHSTCHFLLLSLSFPSHLSITRKKRVTLERNFNFSEGKNALQIRARIRVRESEGSKGFKRKRSLEEESIPSGPVVSFSWSYSPDASSPFKNPVDSVVSFVSCTHSSLLLFSLFMLIQCLDVQLKGSCVCLAFFPHLLFMSRRIVSLQLSSYFLHVC